MLRETVRFRFKIVGSDDWLHGVCVKRTEPWEWQDAWMIYMHNNVWDFEEDPWEILGQVVAMDGEVAQFEWLDETSWE